MDAEGIPHDVEPPSLASTGPSYRSIDEEEEAARQKRRGVCQASLPSVVHLYPFYFL